MSVVINDTMETTVEYLYTSDTDLSDEPTKCGEIFVNLKTFHCVFFCDFCTIQSTYTTFDDFVNHVRGEHLSDEHSVQPQSPINGITEEVVEDIFTEEKYVLNAVDADEIDYTHWEERNKVEADEELENVEYAGTSEDTLSLDLDHDVEMLISDLDCTNDDDEQSVDRVEVNVSSYRQCVIEVLDMYRKCIGLWHKQTVYNTSNEIKTATLRLLLEKYSTYYPNRTENDLQDRLNNMKKRFNAEYERLKGNNQEDGDESKLWYFKHLTFLRYANDEEISDDVFQDFNCPSCRNEVAGLTCSMDLWSHIITNHLTIQEKDPLTIEQTRKIFTLQWPEDVLLHFIDLYHEHECLWNIKSRTYHNRSLKANAYKTIVEKFGEIYPNVLNDRESVKDAIRQLREYFNRVVKKDQTSNLLDVSASKRGKIYENLLFLQSVYTPKVQTYTCELCGITFNKMKDFNSHTRSEHANANYAREKCPVICSSDGKSYDCPICHVKFENSDGLATHLNEHLSKKLRKQICEICGANFDDRSNLLIHIRRHTNTKNYVCSVCNKGFVTSTELKSHIVVHSNEKPFVCETCGLRFKYSNRLNTHRLFHGEPKFGCMDCDMKFVTKRHLNEHQRIHAPADAPVVRIKCDICGSLFRNSDSLSRHRRKIHNIKVREQYNMRYC